VVDFIIEQLLRVQIPKAQKDSQVVNLFCTFGICTHKSCLLNVDEIDTCRQFHQRFTYEFFVRPLSIWQIFSMYVRTYVRKKLPKRHSYEKFARIMLMKLTPGVDVHRS